MRAGKRDAPALKNENGFEGARHFEHKLEMGAKRPGTGWATVSCNALSSGQFVNWTIEPNATAPKANVANLYSYYSTKGSATWIYIGQYSNSFRIGLTNP